MVLELAEEFLERYRKGERPPLREYVERHPDLASEIREVFPAMAMMEKIAVADDSLGDRGQESAESSQRMPPLTQLGDFRIIREIGRGGMGIVYEAEQVSLGRHVALKLLPNHALQDIKQKRRFEREARAAAKLHHTNIVPIFGVGDHDGVPYYVMQFIQGLGLDVVLGELNRLKPGAASMPNALRTVGEIRVSRRDVSAADMARSLMSGEFQRSGSKDLGDSEPKSPMDATADSAVGAAHAPSRARSGSGRLSDSFSVSSSSVALPGSSSGTGSKSAAKKQSYWQSVANIGRQVAEALEYAHKQGIQHRDIKPSNLLLDLRGTVWVTDFGLAKVVGPDAENITHTGDILGTLRYMPPEAFEGKGDVRGDLYSLGLTLYELLAMRPAFEEKDRNKLIKRVSTSEPTPLDKARREVPRDLVTIVQKAIAREPSRRYQAAEDLADDLQRFLNDEPIQARRQTSLEHAVRWARHNPGMAVLGGVLTAVLILVTISSLIVAGHMSRLAENERKSAESERLSRQDAEQARNQASTRERSERWQRYRSNIAEASAAQQLQNSSTGQRALEAAPEEYRNWEWRHLHSLLDGASHVIKVPRMNFLAMRLSPDGRQVAVATDPGDVHLFDVATGEPGPVLRGHTDVVETLEYSPDGSQLGSGGRDGTIRLWNPVSGREEFVLRVEGSGSPRLRYRPDGRRLASSEATTPPGKHKYRLWDTTTGQQIAMLGESPDAGSGQVPTFRPDGKRVVAADGKFIHIYDADTGRQLFANGPYEATVDRIVFSPDGKRFLVNRQDGPTPAVFHDGEDGRVLAVLVEQKTQLMQIAFSADGARLATIGTGSEESRIRLWQSSTGKLIATMPGHTNSVNSLAFSSDGKKLASASYDQTARLWDAETGRHFAVLRGHTGQLFSATFSREGSRLVTSSGDSTLRYWNVESGELITVLRGHRGGLGQPEFNADNSRLVSPSTDRTLRIWDMTLAERNGLLRGHTQHLYDVAFRADGKQVATSAWDGTARLWDPDTGKQVGLFRRDLNIMSSVAYSPDGKRIATANRERGVNVWNVAGGASEYFWPGNMGTWRGDGRAEFSPDGKLVAAGSAAGPVRLWNAATGEKIAELSGHDGSSGDVAFAPDGATLASAGHDSTVRLWDVPSRKAVTTLHGHKERVTRIAFNSAGNLIATGSDDETVRIWDGRTYASLSTIPVGSRVYGIAFSPDGTRLAMGCADTTIRLIDVATWQEVVALRGHADFVHAVAWSPDGTRLISCSGDFTARVWDSLSTQDRARAK
jgi:WD40 repeat protein/serine/threonine protein kinase